MVGAYQELGAKPLKFWLIDTNSRKFIHYYAKAIKYKQIRLTQKELVQTQTWNFARTRWGAWARPGPLAGAAVKSVAGKGKGKVTESK